MNQLKLVQELLLLFKTKQARSLIESVLARPSQWIILCVTIGTCARVSPTPSGR